VHVFPAIDLKAGQAVRLRQGRMDDATVYAADPLIVARDFARQGAEYLHVVDLDGAFAGALVNDEVIRKIVQGFDLRVQVGGGIRTLERIAELLALGVYRVILGTAAVKNPQLVEQAVAEFGGERIVVGIDARDGRVAVQGWSETAEITAIELGKAVKEIGIERVVYTDISRDGMLQGVNLESTVRMAQETGLKVIASGGVSSLDDLRRLQQAADSGVAIEGVIIGKALYAGAFSLAEALETIR